MRYNAIEAINKIQSVIEVAERWCGEQVMPEGQITTAALKEIRRIVKECTNE